MHLKILLLSFFLLTPSIGSAGKAAILVIRKFKAPVYKKPSFDSRIIAYAPKGKKLYGTSATRPGIEGFGLFHKVRVKKGIYGYVLDTDVVGFKKKGSSLKKKSKSKKSGLRSTKKNRRARARRNKKSNNSVSRMGKWKGYPLSFVKAVGVSVGMTDYTIRFGGKDLSSNELNFGLKLSGPGWLFKSLPLDLTFVAHFGGIESLNSVSQGNSSGYFLNGDISFPFRLKHSKSWSIYGGLGLLLNYSDFSFTLNDDKKSSSGLNVGAVGTLGFALNKGDWLFKIEPKFYWEKSQYFGTLLSIQRVL